MVTAEVRLAVFPGLLRAGRVAVFAMAERSRRERRLRSAARQHSAGLRRFAHVVAANNERPRTQALASHHAQLRVVTLLLGAPALRVQQ